MPTNKVPASPCSPRFIQLICMWWWTAESGATEGIKQAVSGEWAVSLYYMTMWGKELKGEKRAFKRKLKRGRVISCVISRQSWFWPFFFCFVRNFSNLTPHPPLFCSWYSSQQSWFWALFFFLEFFLFTPPPQFVKEWTSSKRRLVDELK